MADTVVIAVGTFACGCVLESVRKSADAVWVNPVTATAPLIRDGEEFMDVLALDIDGTLAYRLNPPPMEPAQGWPLGMFRPCALPGADLIKRIIDGYHPGRFEHLNPGAVHALRGHADASGAVRGAGWLAVRGNRKAIAEGIRRRFMSIVSRRRLMTGSLAERVRVILLAGTLGGFGSGAQDEVIELTRDIADDLHLDIGLTRLLLLPGTNQSKDRDTSYALTYGVLTELAAKATGAHWQRTLRAGADRAEMVRSRFVPTLLVSPFAYSTYRGS